MYSLGHSFHMSLTPATVAKVASLARLDVPESRRETLAVEMSSILAFIEQLGEVNTDGVEPLRSVVQATQRLRPDAVTDGGKAEAILANAPEKAQGFFVVPKVVE